MPSALRRPPFGNGHRSIDLDCLIENVVAWPMMLFPMTFATVIGLALAVSFPSYAQNYSQDLHDQSRWRGAGTSPQHPPGMTGMDNTSAYLQRRDEEERERREQVERQRRMMENFTNIPDQLRESYPRRADTPYGFR